LKTLDNMKSAHTPWAYSGVSPFSPSKRTGAWYEPWACL